MTVDLLPRPTRFGRYAVAEPPRLELVEFLDQQQLQTVDHESPIPVLDQEDLHRQQIDVSQIVQGADPNTDALGSCTANASMVSLGERLQAVHGTAEATIAGFALSTTDAVASEKAAIAFYHVCTDQTGDPSQEWPPTDCGSSGLYCCQELVRLGIAKSYQTATGYKSMLTLLQHGTVIMGGPFFNAWMEPDANGFVDGDGSIMALARAIQSGVAGGHETCITALEALKFNALGLVDPDQSHVRVRNSWSASWGENGSYRIHLSTLQLLGAQIDYKQFVVQ